MANGEDGDQDARIKHELDVHIDTVTSQLLIGDDIMNARNQVARSSGDDNNQVDVNNQHVKSIDAADFGWHDLDERADGDEQLRIFQRFIAISSNFATLSFASKLHALPDLVKQIKELLLAMCREIRQFADIASHFEDLVQAFVELVMSTRHSMNMALPHLAQSVTQMEIMREALMPDSSHPLTSDDMDDIHWALTNMAFGAEKMLAHATASNDTSERLHERIGKLKSDIQTKIRVIDKRIEYSQLVPTLGCGLGVGTLTVATLATIESAALGGAGALVLGGLAFPPLGALIAAAMVGGLAVGSVFALIIKLWKKHQFKALGYLVAILENLSKLSSANLSFMNHMKNSKESLNTLLSSVNTLRTTIATGSRRHRRTHADACDQAIRSTKDMIACIKVLAGIDLRELVDSGRNPKFTSASLSLTR